MSKIQTHTLEFTPDFDFLLIGIFSAYRDFTLCSALNRYLQFKLEKQDDLEMKLDKKGSTGRFPYFFFLSDDEEEVYLISNKGSKSHFIPELKQCDYFLLIKNQSRFTSPEEIENKIKFISIISCTLQLDPFEIKSAENFLFLEPVIERDQEKPKLPPIK